MGKINLKDGYVPYSGGRLTTIKNLLLGNVVYHQGSLYATPNYVRKLKSKKLSGR